MSDQTVYVNDYYGPTEVYHRRKTHATYKNRRLDHYVDAMTVEEARDEGLRPCKVCFAVATGRSCPTCGFEGDGDDVLANDQLWCPNTECRVVSFRAQDSENSEDV